MADETMFNELYPLDPWKDPEWHVAGLYRMTGKSGFVTGGAGGLGRNTAAALAQQGANVALVDIPGKTQELETLANEMSEKFNVNVIAIPCDVTDPEQVSHMRDTLANQFATLDFAFLNAGVNIPGDDADISEETWQQTININLTGAWRTAKAAYGLMREQGHGGSLCFTSSLSGHNANYMMGGPTAVNAYGATKAAICEHSRYLAAALAPDGIRSNTISPGYIWSGIFDGRINKAGHDAMLEVVPMRRFGRNEEIAATVLFLLSDASSYVTGTDIQVDGGYSVY